MEQKSQSTKERHVAFLSSLSGPYETLRQRIHAACWPQLWVAEVNRSDLLGKPSMLIVDDCIEALSHSELFICLLIGHDQQLSSGGTAIRVGEIEAQVSYFEIEVFAAAARGLPIIFLQTQHFSANARLAEWLEILKRSAVPLLWETDCHVDDDDLPSRVQSLIKRRDDFATLRRAELAGSTQRLAMELVRARGNIAAVRSGGHDLLWSNRNRFEREYSDDQVVQRATTLLDEVKKHSDPNKQLSRLYLVFRELFAQPYDETNSPDVLRCWNDALGHWWGASSWYGLHNHLSMGVISTLGTQELVRRRLASLSPAGSIDPEDLLPPYGPMASAYYSLGKLLEGEPQREALETSLSLTARVLRERGESDPLIYAVRGCVQFLLKQRARGFASFHRLLKIADRRDSAFLQAEAHSYLGRAFMECRCAPLARFHLQKGVAAITAHVEETSKDHAFLVKALKNLAAFHHARRDTDALLETATKGRALALRHGVYDQLRQLEEFLAHAKMGFK